MAVGVQVFGAAKVSVDDEELGYTRNGADLTDEAFFVDVPGDENGGDEGPPVDIQYLGGIARLRLELTKFDPAVADKIIARIKGATIGQVSDGTNPPGTLLFNGTRTFVVKIVNPGADPPHTGGAGTITFNRAILRNPAEINKGTKFSTLILEIEGHKDDSGIIYSQS